jgi:MerR family transcriptional regulator, heat shock protein HspR
METSNPGFWPRERVAEKFTVSTTTLLRWEGRGLVQPVRSGDLEGYGPVEIRRVWTILTFQRDLGINLAGIEVILRLRDEIQATHARLDDLARTLLATLDEATSADDPHA